MGIDSRRVQAREILASGTSSLLDVTGQFWPKNSTPYLNVGEYKGSNGCHYRGLPLTICGIWGKRRITHSPGTTPTPPITTTAQLRLTSRNNTIALNINTER
jgi:hypothetical protein